jgi:predicted amidohydrolase
MGEVVASAGEEEELLMAEINLEEVEKTRRWLPVLQDRRPDLYRKLLDK